MTDKGTTETKSAEKSNLLPLVLFVGFVFGFIVGYATKDTIMQSLTRLAKTDQAATLKPGATSGTTSAEPTTTEESTTVTTPAEAVAPAPPAAMPETLPPADEPKKEEEKKENEEAAPVPPVAEVPAAE